MEGININEVKKDLLKQKTKAFLVSYREGVLTYKVKFQGIDYQFPIPVFLKTAVQAKHDEKEMYLLFSLDTKGADFLPEMKASELSRWIEKAMDSNDFIKLSEDY